MPKAPQQLTEMASVKDMKSEVMARAQGVRACEEVGGTQRRARAEEQAGNLPRTQRLVGHDGRIVQVVHAPRLSDNADFIEYVKENKWETRRDRGFPWRMDIFEFIKIVYLEWVDRGLIRADFKVLDRPLWDALNKKLVNNTWPVDLYIPKKADIKHIKNTEFAINKQIDYNYIPMNKNRKTSEIFNVESIVSDLRKAVENYGLSDAERRVLGLELYRAICDRPASQYVPTRLLPEDQAEKRRTRMRERMAMARASRTPEQVEEDRKAAAERMRRKRLASRIRT